MRSRPLTILLALAPGLLGCSGGSADAAAAPPGSTETDALVGASRVPSVLDSLRRPEEVPHQGQRLVEVYDETGGRTLAYQERVVADGHGRFSLRPVSHLTPVGADWVLRQIAREGFLMRYRDFAVRDHAQFLANYSVTDFDRMSVVAGRTCGLYLVERFDREKSYELSVDVETGLVLRAQEFDRDGHRLSRMEYESWSAEPDLEGQAWFEASHDEAALDRTADLSEQVGRAVPVPQLLPEGYRLHRAFRLRDEAGEWVKLVYSDGVEPFFFLHRAPSEDAPRASKQDLFLYRLGAAGVAEAELVDGTFVAVGKVSDDELVDAIESAMP